MKTNNNPKSATNNNQSKHYYVYCIYSDEYGFLGVAKNYPTAVKFLHKEQWLTDDITLYDDNNNIVSVYDYFGKDWLDKISKWTIDEFNNFWTGCFSIIKCEVYMG